MHCTRIAKTGRLSYRQQWLCLQQWRQSALAVPLLAQQKPLLKAALAPLPMQSGLLLGLDHDLLDVCPLTHRWVLVPQRVSSVPNGIIGDARNWPMRSHSLDMVLLHHALEFHERPTEVIAEAVRVLCEGGYLVIVGFNPYSALGLYHRCALGADRGLRNGRFIAPSRLNRWLATHHCKRLSTDYGTPKSAHWLHRVARCHHRLWGQSGEYYVMITQKVATPLMPLVQQSLALNRLFPAKKLVEYPFPKKSVSSIEHNN